MDIGINEAAKLANLAVPTLRKFVARNQFPHYRAGRKLWFTIEDVKNWRQSCHREPARLKEAT